MQLRGLW